jgi:hypothetical protein
MDLRARFEAEPMTSDFSKTTPFADLIAREKRSREHLDPELPILQIPIDDGTVMSILPGDRYAFMAGTIVEVAGRRSIPEEHIGRAARILRAEPTSNFSGRLHDVIIGFATLIITDWHSPRWIKRLYEDLERDVEGTLERHQHDPFAMILIRRLQREVVIDPTNPSLDTRAQFIAAIRAAEGRLGDLLRLRRTVPSIFWLEVATMARDHGCDLKLPARDKSRGGSARTPPLRLRWIDARPAGRARPNVAPALRRRRPGRRARPIRADRGNAPGRPDLESGARETRNSLARSVSPQLPAEKRHELRRARRENL